MFAPSSITLFASNSATANMSVDPVAELGRAEQQNVMVMVVTLPMALAQDGPIESLTFGDWGYAGHARRYVLRSYL